MDNPLMGQGANPDNAGMGQQNPFLQNKQGTPAAPKKMPTPQELDELAAHNETAGQHLAELLGNQAIKTSDILKSIGSLVKNKTVTPQQAAQLITTLPTQEDQLRPWVLQHLAQNMIVGRQLHKMRSGILLSGAMNQAPPNPLMGGG